MDRETWALDGGGRGPCEWCGCESLRVLPWGIWVRVGGEGPFHDGMPRADLGCGETKVPQAEAKRIGEE